MKSIIYEDDFCSIVFKKGSSNVLVFSFGDMINLADGDKISAETALSKYNYNVIGVSAKRRNWYPNFNEKMLKEINSIRQRFKTIVCYGGSMGGYAAIKYSKVLCADKVIAFVPQYSINPNDTNDKRYLEYFDHNLHSNMKIISDDICNTCKYTIIYDPYHKEDFAHVQELKRLIDNPTLFKLRFSGHHATSILASSELLNDFISCEISDDQIYRKIRSIKRKKEIYIKNFIPKALNQKEGFFINLLGKQNGVIDIDRDLAKKILASSIRLGVFKKELLNILNFKINLLNESFLCSHHESYLVFNLLTERLECHQKENIKRYSEFLLPISTSLGWLELNSSGNIFYVHCNSKFKTILVKKNENIHDGYYPLISKIKNGYIVISSFFTTFVSVNSYGHVSIDKTEVKAWEKFYIS